jgi:hypothetical protein
MANKVIPFPQSAPAFPQPVIDHQNRIVVHIGRQRVAFDISCRATMLNSEPAPVVVVNSLDGKGRKMPRR